MILVKIKLSNGTIAYDVLDNSMSYKIIEQCGCELTIYGGGLEYLVRTINSFGVLVQSDTSIYSEYSYTNTKVVDIEVLHRFDSLPIDLEYLKKNIPKEFYGIQ